MASTPTIAAASASDLRLPESTFATRPVVSEETVATRGAAGSTSSDVEVFLTLGFSSHGAIPTSVVVSVRLLAGRGVRFLVADGGEPVLCWSSAYEVVDGDTVVPGTPAAASVDLHPEDHR